MAEQEATGAVQFDSHSESSLNDVDLDGCIDSDCSLDEILVDNECGGTEKIVLVPRVHKESKSTFSTTGTGTHKSFFQYQEKDVVDFFLTCLCEICEESMVKRSPRGQKVISLVTELKNLSETCRRDVATLASTLLSQVQSCITSSTSNCKLPSMSEACVWRSFQCMRIADEPKRIWNDSVRLHSQCQTIESPLTLQLFLERALRAMLKLQANAKPPTVIDEPETLTQREHNAIRYMAGYVIVSLLKKYKHPVQNPALHEKYQLFINILSHMKAEQQPIQTDSLSDYTQAWSDLIDRGGVYHVNKQVFQLIEAIELVARQHLNVPIVNSQSTDTNYSAEISKQVLSSSSILGLWEDIASCVPSNKGKYSLELLSAIVTLWTTVRGHSFAKGWTISMNFEKKSLRKTLKQ